MGHRYVCGANCVHNLLIVCDLCLFTVRVLLLMMQSPILVVLLRFVFMIHDKYKAVIGADDDEQDK